MYQPVVMVVNQDEVFMNTNVKENNAEKYQTIRFEVEQGIGLLTINRPDKLNALNQQVFLDIVDCLSAIEDNVRGLIITGEGQKAFIAGADIKAMSTMTESEAIAFSALGHKTTMLFADLPIPVIAAVNGFALGGGFEMAMAADFIYASDNAVFGLPETKLGLIPGFGGTQRLARLIGASKAKELVFTGRNINVDEAVNLGIVVQSFSSQEELLNAAKATLLQAIKNGQLAIAASKKVINESSDVNIVEGLSLENKAFSTLFRSEDMREGVSAFLEKKSASFTGK